MQHVELVVVDGASQDAQWAMAQYFAELDARFPNGFDPGPALEDAGDDYRPPAGAFVVARSEGQVVGCGGVMLLDAETAEIKRMWVSPGARGLGLGRRLLVHLEELAAAAGCRRVVLDTNGVLTEAITMYGRQGYAAIDRYNDNPYAERWFGKDIPASAGQARA